MAISIKLKGKYWDTAGIVHGHIDLKTYLNNLILSKVYPVGAIYISTSSTSPATLFGGTWERIYGRFLLAANDGVEAYNAGKTGGSVTHTLTVDEIPVHNHSVGAHAHGLNSHTHTYARSNDNTNSHTLTVQQIPSHNHKMINGNGVERSFAAMAVANGANHEMNQYIGSNKVYEFMSIKNTGGGQGHTHGVGRSNQNTGASSGNTANSTAFNSGNKGGGKAHSIMPPFLAVYVWKRTK